MRLLRPLLFVFSLALAGCAGTTNLSQTALTPAPVQLDYVDRQKVELQTCLERFDGTQISRNENAVAVSIRCDNIFEKGSAGLNPAVIEPVAEVAKKYSETRIKVEAYTDCVRSEEENLVISEKQAGAVKEALVVRGVEPARIIARGWGESKPAASNATEAGRQANRRVTITLLK